MNHNAPDLVDMVRMYIPDEKAQQQLILYIERYDKYRANKKKQNLVYYAKRKGNGRTQKPPVLGPLPDDEITPESPDNE